MATRLIKDHHSLTRNLKLNGNYISNDGGDEGILVSDTGEIELTPSQVTIDRNSTLTVTSQPTGLKIDFDQTGICASGQYIDAVGLDIDMNCESVTHVGYMDQVGIDIDMVAATAGTQTNIGMNINVSGGDSNNGIYLDCDKGVSGWDIQIVSPDSAADYCRIATIADGETTILTKENGGGSTAHLNLEIDGNVNIEPAGNCTIEPTGGYVYLHDGSYNMFTFNVLEPELRIHDDLDRNDYFSIATASGGVTTISTLQDSGAGGAHLNIEPQGHVEFDGCAVGFDLETPTYNASDTDVSFITGNKQFVTFDGGNITDLNLIFPETSGNFVLLLKQDGNGSRTVTNYKAWDLATTDAADGSATVKFAGGSNPDLTDDANHVDIISIFWDADNQIAYGVASLDFQF